MISPSGSSTTYLASTPRSGRWPTSMCRSGVLVNAELVRLGLGRVNTEIPFKLREEFERHERDAQSARRGLWATLPPAPQNQEPSAGPPRPAGAPVIR